MEGVTTSNKCEPPLGARGGQEQDDGLSCRHTPLTISCHAKWRVSGCTHFTHRHTTAPWQQLAASTAAKSEFSSGGRHWFWRALLQTVLLFTASCPVLRSEDPPAHGKFGDTMEKAVALSRCVPAFNTPPVKHKDTINSYIYYILYISGTEKSKTVWYDDLSVVSIVRKNYVLRSQEANKKSRHSIRLWLLVSKEILNIGLQLIIFVID